MCRSLSDRLRLLRKGGVLGFICADRWMKNRYGGPLRALVAKEFHLKVHVDMTDTPAFHSDVIAYPAITVISRESPGATRIAYRPEIDRAHLGELAKQLTADRVSASFGAVRELAGVAAGSEPWVLAPSDQLAVVRRLEHEFPPSKRPDARLASASRPVRTMPSSARSMRSTSRTIVSSLW